nr:MAG TPA: hypothetical protein [Caudoviricetes sp.]
MVYSLFQLPFLIHRSSSTALLILASNSSVILTFIGLLIVSTSFLNS